MFLLKLKENHKALTPNLFIPRFRNKLNQDSETIRANTPRHFVPIMALVIRSTTASEPSHEKLQKKFAYQDTRTNHARHIVPSFGAHVEPKTTCTNNSARGKGCGNNTS